MPSKKKSSTEKAHQPEKTGAVSKKPLLERAKITRQSMTKTLDINDNFIQRPRLELTPEQKIICGAFSRTSLKKMFHCSNGKMITKECIERVRRLLYVVAVRVLEKARTFCEEANKKTVSFDMLREALELVANCPTSQPEQYYKTRSYLSSRRTSSKKKGEKSSSSKEKTTTTPSSSTKKKAKKQHKKKNKHSEKDNVQAENEKAVEEPQQQQAQQMLSESQETTTSN